MLTQQQKNEIKNLYQQGKSISDIAKELKNGKNTINRYLQKEGLIRFKNKFNEEIEQQIVHEYLGGDSLNLLAEKYSCDAVTINNILKRHDTERRSRGNSFKEISKDTKDLIRKMWEEGKARWDITNELNMGHGTLDRHLMELGLELENRVRSKDKHPNWKGGRHTTKEGYVRILLDASDQLYSMANSSGYILEHRYVMAKHLNSTLPLEWSIHHIDGDRSNNKLENLELRKGEHPPGQICCCGNCGSKNISTMPLAKTDYNNGSNLKPGRVSKLDKNKDKFKIMWEEGFSNKEIRNFFGISESTLNRWIKKLDLKLRRTAASGKNHGKWTGGTTLSSNGYKLKFVTVENPFHIMANIWSYVMEHRYVMAQHLNRPLTDSEYVHHIDGNKVNNAIENLQLIIKHHGKGQCYKCGDCGSVNIIQEKITK